MYTHLLLVLTRKNPSNSNIQRIANFKPTLLFLCLLFYFTFANNDLSYLLSTTESSSPLLQTRTLQCAYNTWKKYTIILSIFSYFQTQWNCNILLLSSHSHLPHFQLSKIENNSNKSLFGKENRREIHVMFIHSLNHIDSDR